MPLHPHARPKLRQHAGHRHATLQGEVQKEPKRDIHLGGRHHLPIGEMVVEWQTRQRDHAHRIFGRAPHGWTVAVLDAVATPCNVEAWLNPPQIVVRGHQCFKDQRVQLGRCGVVVLLQHVRPPPLMDGSMRDPGAPSGKLFKHSHRGEHGRHGLHKEVF